MTKRCYRRFPAIVVSRLTHLALGLALLAGALAPSSLSSQEVARILLRGAGPGEVVAAAEGRAEVVQLERDLVSNLLELRAEETARVADWPVAPDVRRDVLLTRHEVYSPQAR